MDRVTKREEKLRRIRALVRIRWVEKRFLKKVGSQYFSYLKDDDTEKDWYGESYNSPIEPRSIYVSLDEINQKNTIRRIVTSSIEKISIFTSEEKVPGIPYDIQEIVRLFSPYDGRYLLKLETKKGYGDLRYPTKTMINEFASIFSVIQDLSTDLLAKKIIVTRIDVTNYQLQGKTYQGNIYITLNLEEDTFIMKANYRFSFPVLPVASYLSKRLGKLTKEWSIYSDIYDKTDQPRMRIPNRLYEEIINNLLGY